MIAPSVPGRAAPDLIPARMLNEFAYCPRLGYLEWVEGEFADNLETLEGRFGHQRVDQPTRRHVPLPTPDQAATAHDSPDPPGEDSQRPGIRVSTGGDETIHARSLMLSAPNEGLIARLDLLEIDGPLATPVDYKRGSLPDVPEGAFEPERVQLCAQGLILRENGFDCRQGVLYFIKSRRRVVIAFDDELIARTRELAGRFRETAASGQRPLPLVDSPKCPRCSLVGICLPDETNLLAEPPTFELTPLREPGPPRRLLPSHDHRVPLYIQEQGAYIGKSGDCLVIKKKGKLVREVRILDISQLVLFGNAQVSSQAQRELISRGVPILYLSYGGWFHAMTTGLPHKNVELRIRQFRIADDPAARLALARQFIVGKIRNGRTLIMRNLIEDPDRIRDALADYARKAEATDSLESLLGIEGMAAKVYFAGFSRMLKGVDDMIFAGRNRRPPTDPINALLSLLYAMLTKELTVTLTSVGFDPMLGFFHQPRYGRPSLALDLIEEFRPIIVDSVVLNIVNNGEVTSDSFIRQAGAVALTDAGRKTVLAAFERRLDVPIQHPIFGYRLSYRRILEVQARLLARAVTGEIPAYPPFQTR